MTHDATQLITCDGTATLRFRDPNDLQRSAPHHRHRRQGAPVDQLNELEYIHDEIYANVWHTDRIARIDPRDGHVVAWIDLTGLLSPMLQTDTKLS